MRWIIGDIHGMLRPLTTLVEAVRNQDSEAEFFFAGDYVNRGPDSRGVIDYLLSLPNARFTRGNHDDIFDQVLHGKNYADNATREDRMMAYQWFMKYGLDSTFMSYGADIAYLEQLAERPSIEGLDALAQWIPEAHREFIRGLPPAIELDDLFVVHGKWGPDELSDSPGILERLEKQPRFRHSLLWGRFTSDEISRLKAWKRTGYFGHTPVSHYGYLPPQENHGRPDTAAKADAKNGAPASAGAKSTARRESVRNNLMLPIEGNKMVLLDTAAALGASGRLTAYCADTHEYVQTTHSGELAPAGE